jgi:hypothetical protein
MDRDGFLLHGEGFFANVPARRFDPMPPQPLVPWTFPRLATAVFAWLMAGSFPALSQPVTAKERRV